MSKTVLAASLALAFLLGYSLGLFGRQIEGVTWNKELRLDYILNIAVTLALAFIINQVFNPAWNRSSGDRRGERVLLVEVVKNAVTELTETRAIFDQCYAMNPLPDDWSNRMVTSVQRHSNAIKSIENAITHCGLKNDKLKLGSLAERREAYRDALTDSPFPKHYGDAAVRMRNHNGAYFALLDELNRLMLDLNKA